MRKIRMLLAASIVAVPLAATAAAPAAACPRHACPGDGCGINPPVTVQDDVIYFNNGPLVTCRP